MHNIRDIFQNRFPVVISGAAYEPINPNQDVFQTFRNLVHVSGKRILRTRFDVLRRKRLRGIQMLVLVRKWYMEEFLSA